MALRERSRTEPDGAFTAPLDDLGRLVIPVRMRRALGWANGTWVRIRLEGDRVVVTTWDPTCWVCGTAHATQAHRGHPLCEECYRVLVQHHRLL